ncbi:MAG: glycerol-3-phosphate dehydrogenase, partial [Pseudomonadota bacterium]|nr:glycerol-3-phosphate dehydrogenase [Pseudomonadota bacterium]
SCVADLGIQFGCGLSETEVRYLIAREYALTADDILRRRSKLYLHLTAEQQQQLEIWLMTEQEKQTA